MELKWEDRKEEREAELARFRGVLEKCCKEHKLVYDATRWDDKESELRGLAHIIHNGFCCCYFSSFFNSAETV